MKTFMIICFFLTIAFSYGEIDYDDIDDGADTEDIFSNSSNELENDSEEENDEEDIEIQNDIQADPATYILPKESKWSKLKRRVKKFNNKLKNKWRKYWLRRKLKKALKKGSIKI
ncbi:uncharacterized protein LOC124807948 [Hydra vulgaris]|uniref:uncharacterized protein LOC124807948 n=1 Tax=Hydra vulgaris TaxID=6087 RepID=UPI00019263F4|nr:uncharacterized protein LOC124807948 [Hydra vulgaris]